MKSQFHKGVIEMCVLNLIATKDYYGYELVEKISQTITISEGTIYPILRRLTKEGHFTTYLKESQEGPPRKYYTISKDGKTHAQETRAQWLEFTNSIKEIIFEGEN